MRAKLGLLAVVALGAAIAPASAVEYSSLMRGKALFHIVTADLNDESVSAETRYFPRLTSLSRIWGDDVPVAAITGTFFAWENQKPVAEVVVDGEVQCQGKRGSVLAVDWFGRVHIFHPSFRQDLDWFPFRYAIRGAVRLIEDGRVVPDPRSQHFRDSSIWGTAARTAVGTTAEGKLVMVATKSPVTLSQLGWAMCGVGVTDAVSLDGGGSTALFYRGHMVIPTGRPLCNLFVIYERSPFDTTYHTHLARVAQDQSESILKAIGRRKS